MPRKTFTAGEVLAAADVNEYLMDQSVMTFADSGARGSAIGTAIAQEGMLTYLEDTDAFEYWDGAAFTSLVTSSGGAATNAIINGAFEINQRGFSSSTANGAYGFDRWFAGLVDGTATYSSQAFTLGAGPTGYESANFARLVTSGQTLAGAVANITQVVEDVRTFAGQNATFSFFAKAASGTPQMAVELQQSFGSGGSPSSDVFTLAGKVTLSTSWQRFELTVAVPSISGKTLGTTASTSGVKVRLFASAGSNFNARTDSLGIQSNTFDIWGVQLEAGSTATPFRRNANSLQGELAACQRYYVRFNNSQEAPYTQYGSGSAFSTTGQGTLVRLPVTMRAAPTSLDQSASNTFRLYDGGGTDRLLSTALTLESAVTSKDGAVINATSSSLTQSRTYTLTNNNNANAFIGFSAEL